MGIFNLFKNSKGKTNDKEAIPNAESKVQCFYFDPSRGDKADWFYALNGNVYFHKQVIGKYIKEKDQVVVQTNFSKVQFENKKLNGSYEMFSFHDVNLRKYERNDSFSTELFTAYLEKSRLEVSRTRVSSDYEDKLLALYEGDTIGAIAAVICAHSVVITNSLHHRILTE